MTKNMGEQVYTVRMWSSGSSESDAVAFKTNVIATSKEEAETKARNLPEGAGRRWRRVLVNDVQEEKVYRDLTS